MNWTAGMMTLDRNWARKPASYSSSFLMRKRSSISRRRPNTLTRAWPVNASSTWRSEEHTSELQSRGHLVCRLLLEKKKTPDKSADRLTAEHTCRAQAQHHATR